MHSSRFYSNSWHAGLASAAETATAKASGVRARVRAELTAAIKDLARASGYLVKDRPAAELVAAVRVIAAGDALLSPTITKRLIEEFVSKPEHSSVSATLPEDLTDREYEALEHLAHGLSNREIATAMFVHEATAKTHVSRLLTKLGVRDRVQAVVIAYESGVVEVGNNRPGPNPK